MEPRYLNVDCVLRSQAGLGSLLEYIKGDVFTLWSELSGPEQSAGFETKLPNSKGPQDDIAEFLRIFLSLPTELKRVLERCSEKKMDIGFESGQMGEPISVAIPPQHLQQLAQLGFTLSVRLYPQAPDEDAKVPA